jgi:hypothetical protein
VAKLNETTVTNGLLCNNRSVGWRVVMQKQYPCAVA